MYDGMLCILNDLIAYCIKAALNNGEKERLFKNLKYVTNCCILK